MVKGICVKRDPPAPYPRAHVVDSFFGGLDVGIEFHDYILVELSHGGHEWCPMPVSYLLLEVRVFIIPQLDSPLSEE